MAFMPWWPLLGSRQSHFLGHKEIISISYWGVLLIYLGVKAFNTPPIALEKPLKGTGFFTTLIQTMLINAYQSHDYTYLLAAFAAIGFEGKQHEFHEALLLAWGFFADPDFGLLD